MLVIITCLTKVSICFLVLRIPTNKTLIRSLYILIVSLLVVNGATTIVFLAQCRPLEALWNPEVKGHCWSIKVYLYIGYLQGGMFLGLMLDMWLIYIVSSLCYSDGFDVYQPAGSCAVEGANILRKESGNLWTHGTRTSVSRIPVTA